MELAGAALAAIPATLAMGADARTPRAYRAAARQKQHLVQQKNEQPGKTLTKPALPAGPATAVFVTGLVVASVVYHTQVGGI